MMYNIYMSRHDRLIYLIEYLLSARNENGEMPIDEGGQKRLFVATVLSTPPTRGCSVAFAPITAVSTTRFVRRRQKIGLPA